MNKEYTKEELVAAIRNATALGDLKRMVGPAEGESEKAAGRLEQIAAIWTRCEKHYGSDTALWPTDDKEIYDRLMKEQGAFESEYC